MLLLYTILWFLGLNFGTLHYKCIKKMQFIWWIVVVGWPWLDTRCQGATGTNWSRGSSSWAWGRTSSLWGWQTTGTGCPGRLWSLLLCRYSRPAWTRSCAACTRWPCFSRGVGLGDPQRSLPTPAILWFCDSVISCCDKKLLSKLQE